MANRKSLVAVVKISSLAIVGVLITAIDAHARAPTIKIPEPATALMLGLGASAVVARRWWVGRRGKGRA